MKVKIIKGVYGHHRANGLGVTPITVGETVDVSAEEAARLVSKLGVAEYVDEAIETKDKPLSEFTAKELRAYCEQLGLAVKGNASKAELIAAIERAIEEGNPPDGDTGEAEGENPDDPSDGGSDDGESETPPDGGDGTGSVVV